MGTWKVRSLSSKIVSSIVLVLVVTLGFNLWATQRRINNQAEQAFIDKLRTMTDVALGSRISSSEGGHAWEIAQRYAKTQSYAFRTPARAPNNPEDAPNAFDERAFIAFESQPLLTQYVERVQTNGQDTMLFARPVAVTEDCQACHGWELTAVPKGARTRQLSALFSIQAPLGVLAANEKANAQALFLAALITLLLTSGTVLIVLRRLVLVPLKSALHLANCMAANDLTKRLSVRSEDEIGQMGSALNQALAKMSGAIRSVAENAERVASASEELSTVSQEITSNSEETTAQANVVTSATDKVNRNLQTVATGAEEMSSTIQEITRSASESARVAGEAVITTQATNATIAKLGVSSAEIGQVIKAITSIAQQTNLLALNATIEAARAGEAGKGFAVVANEVKELAKQTARETEDISRKIAAIQTDSRGAVDAIAAVGAVINRINDISSTIATAVEEQGATTNEVSRNVSEAAKGSSEISQNIVGVAEAAQGTSSRAHESLKAAKHLAQMSTQLRQLVEQFKVNTEEEGNGNKERVVRVGAR